jgi:hypothetical protein
MSKKETKTKELEVVKPSGSPMENFFDLPTTVRPKEVIPKKEIIAGPAYDKKDDEVEELYANIHDAAMHIHTQLIDEVQDMEPGDGMKNYNMAAVYLEMALKAAEKRGKLKEHKDKHDQRAKKATVGTNITNNTLTINTTDLIKQLTAVKPDVIEGEVVQIEEEQDKKTDD